MANQPETPAYDAGVYQLQTTDPVQGGASGVSNTPLLNLANRTAYLKQHMDAIENGTTVPTGLATLNSPQFTGDPKSQTPALGDSDTSIATSDFVQKTVAGLLTKSVAGNLNVTLTTVEWGNGIWLFNGALTGNIDVIVPNTAAQKLVLNRTTGGFTLRVKTAAGTGIYVAQGKQQELACDGTNVFQATNDLSSAVLDGTPTLTNTPAQFDNSSAIANTAFVQRALGNYSGEVVITVATTFTTAHAGKLIVFNSASALTHTLPAANTMPAGSQVTLYFYGAGAQTIQRANADTIGIPSSINSFIGTYGDTAVLESDGISQWRLIGGSLNLPNSGVIAGPNFTTPSMIDVSGRLATTSFVKKSLGNRAGIVGLAGNKTLTLADCGVLQAVNAPSLVLTMPLASTVPSGGIISVYGNISSGIFTVNRQGSDLLNIGGPTGQNLTSVTIGYGETVDFVSDTNAWYAIGRSGFLGSTYSFAASLGSNSGYQRLPSGMLMQWGFGTMTATGATNTNVGVIFPTTFPNNCWMVTGSFYDSFSSTGGGSWGVRPVGVTTSGFTAVGDNNGGNYNFDGKSVGFSWFAIGR